MIRVVEHLGTEGEGNAMLIAIGSVFPGVIFDIHANCIYIEQLTRNIKSYIQVSKAALTHRLQRQAGLQAAAAVHVMAAFGDDPFGRVNLCLEPRQRDWAFGEDIGAVTACFVASSLA